MSDANLETVKLKIKDLAPNFKAEVQNPDGTVEEVELYKLLETQKVLLVFYPGDDTPGCKAQLCGLRDVFPDYQKYGVKILGVNQASEKSHLKFIQKYNFPFGIVVDSNKTIREQYGATKSFFRNITTKRGVFLINQDKSIEYIFWGQQDNQEILQLLSKKV